MTNEAKKPLSPEVVEQLIAEHAWAELFRELFSRPPPSHSELRIAQIQAEEKQADDHAEETK